MTETMRQLRMKAGQARLRYGTASAVEFVGPYGDQDKLTVTTTCVSSGTPSAHLRFNWRLNNQPIAAADLSEYLRNR